MADSGHHETDELAQRLRHWIVLGGYLLGGWAILQTVLLIITWGLPFNHLFRVRLLVPIHRTATVCWMVAPILLVAGCWGFQQHRRWARPVLLIYAGLWIVGVFGVQAVQFIDALSGTFGDFTLRQEFSLALGGFDLAVYGSVFPVLVVLCLLRPEIRDHFPEFRAGFEPIIDGESNQPLDGG